MAPRRECAPRSCSASLAVEDLSQGVPKTFSVVADGWSPTYVLYSPQAAKLFTNECWLQVKAV